MEKNKREKKKIAYTLTQRKSSNKKKPTFSLDVLT